MAKYSAMDIAGYIIKKCTDENKYINNIKLQKILYFIQREFLIEKDKPLFDDDFVAWKYGPVILDIYYEFVPFGARELYYGAFYPLVPDIEKQDKEIIDNIVENNREMYYWDLVEKSHTKGGAWDRTWKNGVGRNHIITKESIKQYG